MGTFPRDIQLYVTPDGKAPFSQWLSALRDPKARAKIRVRLDRVRLGNLGDQRPVGEGVWEFRIDYCAVRNLGGRSHQTAQSAGRVREGRRPAPFGRARGEGRALAVFRCKRRGLPRERSGAGDG